MIERIESKFKYGDIVTPISGAYKGETGVVYKKPTKENGYHYTIITEDKPYGYWATDDELVMQFTEATDKKDIRAVLDKVYAIKLRNEAYDKYIPEDMNPDEFFAEMAEINTNYQKDHPDCKFRVWVYGNDGPIPHVHMKFKGGAESVIKLFSAEYLNGHVKNFKELNSSERKELIKFFNTEVKDVDGNKMKCWLQAVELWKDCITGDETRMKAFNDIARKDDKGNYIMPDYSTITTPHKLTTEFVIGEN